MCLACFCGSALLKPHADGNTRCTRPMGTGAGRAACDALLDVFSPSSSIRQSNQKYDLYIACVGDGDPITVLPILPRACLGRSHDSPTHIAGEHRTGTLANLKGILTKRELTSLSCKFQLQRESKLQTPPAKINWTILRTPLPKLRPFNAGSWELGCFIFFFEISRSALKGRVSKNYGSCPSEDRPVYFGGACSHFHKGDRFGLGYEKVKYRHRH